MARAEKTFRFVALALFFGICFAGCARYAVKVDLPAVPKKAEALVSQRLSRVQAQLESHLRKRGLTYQIHRSKSQRRVDIEVDWVKSLSLNYQYLSFGPRKRHMAHWKSVWRLEASRKSKVRILVENMELVFVGPQNETPAEVSKDGSWASSPGAYRRANLELNRFLKDYYKTHAFVRNFNQIVYDTSPLGTRAFRKLTLQNAPRTSPF